MESTHITDVKIRIKRRISQIETMFKYARVGFSFNCTLLLHTVLLVLLMVGDWCQSCRHWRLCVTFSNPVHHTSAAVTSFNLRVVRILSSRACLAAIRIKERLVVVSQSSFIQLWKYVEHREREKKSTSGGSLALTHLFALVLSYLSSRTSFYLSFFLSTSSSTIPAPCESHTSFPFLSATLPPFHFSSLASRLYHSPLLTFYLSIHSPRFAAKNSPYISEVRVSFIFSCCLIRCLSVSSMCHPFH